MSTETRYQSAIEEAMRVIRAPKDADPDSYSFWLADSLPEDLLESPYANIGRTVDERNLEDRRDMIAAVARHFGVEVKEVNPFNVNGLISATFYGTIHSIVPLAAFFSTDRDIAQKQEFKEDVINRLGYKAEESNV